MRRIIHSPSFLLFIPLVMCLAGCADQAAQAPTAPTAVLSSVPAASAGVQSSSAAAKTSAGCYAVKFQMIAEDPDVSDFHLSGDLVGTSEPTFDSDMKFAGVTIANHGTAVWTITGGVIPGLTTFQTTFDNRNILSDRPGSPGDVFENIGTHRAISGVAKANLTYHGSLIYQPPVTLLSHQYQGVICPSPTRRTEPSRRATLAVALVVYA